jgi:hypothetical protein
MICQLRSVLCSAMLLVVSPVVPAHAQAQALSLQPAPAPPQEPAPKACADGTSEGRGPSTPPEGNSSSQDLSQKLSRLRTWGHFGTAANHTTRMCFSAVVRVRALAGRWSDLDKARGGRGM